MRPAPFLAVLTLLACTKETPAPAPVAAVPVPVAAAAPAAPPAPAAAPALKLECGRIISAELAAKHGLTVGAAKLDETKTLADCDFKGPKGEVFKVGISCPPWGADEKVMRKSMEGGKQAFEDAREIQVGRMGYVGTMVGVSMIQFWDDDAPCFVTMTVQDEAAGTAFAKDVVANLTPASIAP